MVKGAVPGLELSYPAAEKVEVLKAGIILSSC
jgi:hypothetical protein